MWDQWVQEAAGESDVNKILETFAEDEEVNYSLFKYIQVSIAIRI